MAPHDTLPPSAADSQERSYRMIDVGGKAETRRRAVAEGRISMAPATLARVRDRTLPKGDALALAEVAGIVAAKKTPEILPLCHPLLLDAVKVRCEVEGESSVVVTCEVVTSAKTGVEMEALTGASAALLSIYDLVKGVDPALEISGVFLRTKEGGRSGNWVHPKLGGAAACAMKPAADPGRRETLSGVRAAVLTVSDRRSRGEGADGSGAGIADWLGARGASASGLEIVPDEVAAIRAAVGKFVEEGADCVLVTGGTGLSSRDVTPEALAPLWTKPVPGIGEALRASGARHTPLSWLSRSEGGLVGRTFVVLLPGSPKAVREGLDALEPLFKHALHVARGGDHS